MPRKKTTETKVEEAQATIDVKPAESKGEIAVQSESSTVLSMIERVALNKDIDINRLERLIDMQQGIHKERARIEYDNAMAAAQEEMEPVRVNADNPQTRSKYADYAALDRAIRSIYAKHGFSLSFNSGDGAPPDHVRVQCRVAHRNGHREMHHLDMPADGKGAKGGDVMTRTHATGSAVTYGKRYVLGMIFNLAVTRDDDGNAAGGRGRVDPDVERLKDNDRKKGTLDKTMTEPFGGPKNWADYAIQTLNATTTPHRTVEQVQHFAKSNAPVIRWIEANDPKQYERIKTAYENALEAASKYKSSAATSSPPHGQDAAGAQPEVRDESKSSAPADGTSTPTTPHGESGPVGGQAAQVTDVVDQNEALIFNEYPRVGDFFAFADSWLEAPQRTEAELVAFGAFYHTYILDRLKPEYAHVEAMKDTKRIYDEALKKAQQKK